MLYNLWIANILPGEISWCAHPIAGHRDQGGNFFGD
jgi:hypothetical protein